MALLILLGWAIIVFRWMFAIFYFPGKYNIPNKGCFHVEDFWIRHIFEVMDDIEFLRPSWDQHVSGGGFLQNLKLRFLKTLKANYIEYPLLYLQRFVILFSRLCCFLSEKILFIDKTRFLIVGTLDHDFDYLQEALNKLIMPGETHESLLAGSVKAFKLTKGFMEKGRREGIQSERLIEFLRSKSADQNSEGVNFVEALRKKFREEQSPFDYLTKFSWKMTALSLIQVIIELEGRGADDAVDAYSQAYDFLDLLDNPSSTETQLFVRAADKQFIIIKQLLERNNAPSPGEKGTMQEAREKVMDLRASAAKFISFNSNDSMDWWAIAADNSLEKVCTIILENDTTDLMNKVRRLLTDILAIALEKEVGRELVNKCRAWAEILEDEKIKASVYIAGKLNGVITKLNQVMQPVALTDENLSIEIVEDEKFKASVYVAEKLSEVIAKLNGVMQSEETDRDLGVGIFGAF